MSRLVEQCAPAPVGLAHLDVRSRVDLCAGWRHWDVERHARGGADLDLSSTVGCDDGEVAPHPDR